MYPRFVAGLVFLLVIVVLKILGLFVFKCHLIFVTINHALTQRVILDIQLNGANLRKIKLGVLVE